MSFTQYLRMMITERLLHLWHSLKKVIFFAIFLDFRVKFTS